MWSPEPGLAAWHRALLLVASQSGICQHSGRDLVEWMKEQLKLPIGDMSYLHSADGCVGLRFIAAPELQAGPPTLSVPGAGCTFARELGTMQLGRTAGTVVGS